MTTNIDLFKIAKNNGIRLDHIIYKDELSIVPYKKNTSIIMNSSTEGHEGVHWLAIYLLNDTILYFDSFGIEPDMAVVDYARKHKKKIIYNDYQVESLYGTNCGQLSLLFLKLCQMLTE